MFAVPVPADAALARRAAAGDRVALDALFAAHRAVAYRVAYRLLGNEADALDAVQEGFVNALRSLDRFAGRSSFRTWLLRVVTNAALDAGRVRRRRDSRTNGPLPADDPAHATDGDAAAELDRAVLRAALDEALAGLPDAQRRTFVLHVDGGLSYREVADALGVSVGTVMSRLFYARQKLKLLLAPHVNP